MAPDVEPYDQVVISKAFVQVIEQVGKAVLISHSQGAGLVWQSAIDNSNVQGDVCLVLSSGFEFPKGELPEPIDLLSP